MAASDRELIAARRRSPTCRRTSARACCASSPAASVDDGKSHADRAAAVRLEDDLRGPAGRARAATRRRSARRAASSTSRCWSTAWRPSASRASPSTSPTASSPPSGASSSSPTRPGHEQYTRNMVTGASTADARGDPGRRAQGRAHPDPPPQLPRVAARHPPRRAGGQQDGPGRLRAEARSTRSSPTTARSPRSIGIDATSPPSRCRRCTATTSSRRSARIALVPGPDAARASGDASRSTPACTSGRSACRCNG